MGNPDNTIKRIEPTPGGAPLVAPYVLGHETSSARLVTGGRATGLVIGLAAVWALTGMSGSLDLPWQSEQLNFTTDTNNPAGSALVAAAVGNDAAHPIYYGPPLEADPNAPPVRREMTLRLASGDTLIETLTAAGAPIGGAYRAVAAFGKDLDVKRLQVGQQIDLALEADAYQYAYGDDNGSLWRLASVSVRSDFDEKVVVTNNAEGRYLVSSVPVPTVAMTRYGEGVIDDSLFLAAERADVPAEIIIELIRIFSFSVDFQREIWPGDTFAVYYQREATRSGLEVQEGDILYARLTLRGKEHSFYRFDPGAGGRVDYFDSDGKSARRALMKTPIDGARLSSSYGRRKHPVLGYVRNHPGVDFSTGRSGTPIYAAGDGVVLRSSRYSTYGNYIRIRHNSTYETAYAHLSKYGRGIKKGARVTQGQIIGYVGATGRVTGPHLHYEVFVNGSRVNPTRLKLPTGRTLSGAELETYAQMQEQADNSVAALQAFQMIARAVTNDQDIGGDDALGAEAVAAATDDTPLIDPDDASERAAKK